MAFKENLQKYVEKGVEASKEAFSKAGAAVSKFGDDSIIRIEKHQYENQLKEEYQSLGEYVAEKLSCEQNVLDLADEVLKEKLDKIKKIQSEIKAREDSLKK